MRNLLWRGIAVALAGCISWLLWHWPAPAEPVEFVLDINCNATPLNYNEAVACAEPEKSKETPKKLTKAQQFLRDVRCVGGVLFLEVDGELRNVGWCTNVPAKYRGPPTN